MAREPSRTPTARARRHMRRSTKARNTHRLRHSQHRMLEHTGRKLDAAPVDHHPGDTRAHEAIPIDANAADHLRRARAYPNSERQRGLIPNSVRVDGFEIGQRGYTPDIDTRRYSSDMGAERCVSVQIQALAPGANGSLPALSNRAARFDDGPMLR